MTTQTRRPRRMTPYMVALNHVQNRNQQNVSASDGRLVPGFAFDASTLALLGGLTLTRAGSGSYHTSAGLVAQAASGAPRFDYESLTGQLRGLLIEESRTNLLTNSEELIYNWNASGLDVAENVVTSPDGAVHGNSLTSTKAADACRTRQSFGATNGQVYTFSAYFKAGTANAFMGFSDGGLGIYATLKATLSGAGSVVVAGSGASGSIHALPNGWYRASLIWTATITASTYADLGTWDGSADEFGYPGTGAIGETVYVWGTQLEAAATASSYIQTQGTTITRPADVVVASNISGWVNDAAGALVAEFIRPLATASMGVIGSLNAGNDSSAVALLAAGDGTTLQGRFNVAGVASNPGDLAPALAAGAVNAVALGYAAQPGVQMLSNGGTLVAGSQLGAMWGAGALTQLCLGCNPTHDGAFLNGWLRKFAYYPQALTQVELQALTAPQVRV